MDTEWGPICTVHPLKILQPCKIATNAKMSAVIMRKASYPPLITELPYATLTQLHRDRINVIAMSAFGGKADMARAVRNVR